MEETKVFVSGVSFPLYETVVPSQGIQVATRAQITFEEILKYIKYKNLFSPFEALRLHSMHRS